MSLYFNSIKECFRFCLYPFQRLFGYVAIESGDVNYFTLFVNMIAHS